MNCKSVQNRLSAYLDRELGGDELLQIRAHLSTCKECRAESDGLRALKSLLGGVPCPEPSEDLCERLTANMMRLRYEEPKRTLKVSAVMFASVAACSMLGTLFFMNSGLAKSIWHGRTPSSGKDLAIAQNGNPEAITGSDPAGPIISAANFVPR